MSKSIAILGAGGHGKVIAEIALLNNFETIKFFDDDYLNIKDYPYEVKGNIEFFQKINSNYKYWFVAIGNNEIRKKIILDLKYIDKNLTKLFHPKSVISSYSEIGNGVCVMANAAINPGAKIKRGSIINTSASIDHDCTIGEFVHIGPNTALSGNVSVGQHTLVGTGTSVHPGIKIGKNVKIGVGSNVFKDLIDNSIFTNK